MSRNKKKNNTTSSRYFNEQDILENENKVNILVKEVFNLIFLKYNSLHGENFELEEVLKNIFKEKYPNLFKSINFIWFSKMIYNYYSEVESKNKNCNFLFTVNKNKDDSLIFHFHVTFPEQNFNLPNPGFSTLIKLILLFIPFLVLSALTLIPDFFSYLNFSKIFFSIFFILYLWLISLTGNVIKIHLLFSAIYGFTLFTLTILNENNILFYPYDKILDLNIVSFSFVILTFILILNKILYFFIYGGIFYNTLSLVLKKDFKQSNHISKFIINNNKINKFGSNINNKLSLSINEFISKNFNFDLKLEKITSSKKFLIFSSFYSFTFLLFLIQGPIHKDYFEKNIYCDLINKDSNITKSSDIYNKFYEISDIFSEKKILVHSYNEYKLTVNIMNLDIEKYDRNTIKPIDTSDLSFFEYLSISIWPFNLEPRKKYIYLENCNN